MSFNLQLYQETWLKIARIAIINTLSNNIQTIPLRVFDSLTSSNTKLWELIDRGTPTPTAVIALQQTAGKGQWGNSWVSSGGGLYLSVALDIDLDINHSSHLVMATAWGIATVLRYYQLPVTIKWSNDLILDNRKLGGIKIETRNHKKKLIKAVIGVGINWHNPIPNVGINLKSYYQNKAIKSINSLEELTAIASYGISFGYQYYLSVGIEQLLANYLAILNSIGKQVIINNSLGEVIGVTQDGKIKIQLRSPGASSTITFAPGQISLGY
ncbi:biotin--[acetyl-CoA-carboxylase] ligase [Waterburya agarophytonicola K14]|uniref:Biotin--[acetyl-CoA-carboxylase] ligase n=1 Tax=Waterburya agarophytonicola KI4 TaxID=2874699 RepID=A0A964BTR4_9CYAN|nr:biotin--[acetyl-CoA-carboxylase] ligase [Waterburya agarophytonicola KI4]